jgi:DNA sulfur modification protein DndC
LERAIKKGYYEDADDALQFAQKLRELRDGDPIQTTQDEEITTDASA